MTGRSSGIRGCGWQHRPGARRYYYEYNSGLQAQSALYTMASLDDFDNATLVFDPNALSKDGTVAGQRLRVQLGRRPDRLQHRQARCLQPNAQYWAYKADRITWPCVAVCLCISLVAFDFVVPAARFLRMN